jgi:hypothetical protein
MLWSGGRGVKTECRYLFDIYSKKKENRFLISCINLAPYQILLAPELRDLELLVEVTQLNTYKIVAWQMSRRKTKLPQYTHH